MYVSKTMLGSGGVLCMLALNAIATPLNSVVDSVLNVCTSPDLQVASDRGQQLGWREQTEAETHEWRTHFVAYNGGSVELIGWQDGEADKADKLSFWIAVGPNGHKACVYSTSNPTGLLEKLTARLGPPDTSDKDESIELLSASWKQGSLEYSYTQVGSAASVNVGPTQ